MATAEELGRGGVDHAGRPLFIATDHTRYSGSTDRELTDQEQLAWKTFQLWRSSLSIERRDNVYMGIINSDFTNFRLSYHIMGTPYPQIDTTPGMFDTVKSVRWYEHLTSFAVACGYTYWIRSKASTRNARFMPSSRIWIGLGTFFLTEMCFLYRSNFRLAGYLPNDYECRKYGVLESKERLEKKKELWTKYANYKREWCRRFDYHVYGIRPGENWGLFSACWIPAWEPMFCKKTDYPPRKNPYFLSTTPLREMFTEGPPYNYTDKVDSIPLVKAKPELKYAYHSPLDAGKSVHEQS